MYSKSSYVSHRTFKGFGAILSPSDVLVPGSSYTFTYSPSFWDNIKHPLDVDSPSAIMAGLRSALSTYGMSNLTAVNRGLFANTWAITIVPDYSHSLQDWIDAFNNSFSDMGYSPSFIQAEGGTISTQPGGVGQVLTEAAAGVSQAAAGTTGALIKPLIPYLLLGGAVYLGIFFLPTIMRRQRARLR